MGIVAKNDQDGGAGGDSGSGQPTDPPEPRERRHNLPLKAAPIVGRKAELQRVVSIFDLVRRDQARPRRVEVVGQKGVGASTVAVELARRAGHRFPGGAWYVNLSMGADVAWATLEATRSGKPVKNLAAAARSAREKLGDEPKSLLVLDAASSADEAMAALPPVTKNSADVFVVAEQPLGTVDADQVCEVSPVPRHGARRIALSMLRSSPRPEGTEAPENAPPVRTMDGLAVTASLAARAALAYGGKAGPMTIEDPRAALQAVIRLVAGHPTALELLLLASVAHPVCLPLDALFAALVAVREGRGNPPTEEDAGKGVMWLAHAGIIEPLDERHFSMHPILQSVVHGMTQSPQDLVIARTALASGLVAEAEDAISDEGVDLSRAALHQLRFLASTTEGDVKTRVDATIAKLESALGMDGAAAASVV